MTKDLGASTGSREPSPSVSALPGFDPERIIRAFNSRLNIYRSKRAEANPFGADCYSRHEALTYVIDAIELTAIEAGLSAYVPRGEEA